MEKHESEIEALKDLGNALKNETENLNTIITENSEKIQHLEEIRCPIEKSGYFEVLGKCLFTDTIKRNFDDSQAHCKEIFPVDGRLFEPRDQSTNEEVGRINKDYKIKHLGTCIHSM